MKANVPSVLFVILAAALAAQAEPAKVESVIDLLQEAKKSATPLPLLEKAKEQFKNYRAKDTHEERGAGIGRRHAAVNGKVAHEDKADALAAIEEAITVAKAGGSAVPKIDHAIALVHKTGDMK